MLAKLKAYTDGIRKAANLSRDVLLDYFNKNFAEYKKKLDKALLAYSKLGNSLDEMETTYDFKIIDITNIREMLMCLMKIKDLHKDFYKLLQDLIKISDPELFDIDNQANMRWLLYKHSKLPVKTFTEKGAESLSIDAIKLILISVPDLPRTCAYLYSRNRLKHVYNTFIRNYQNRVGTDGHIHASYNLTSTMTARLSSTNPNQQQLVASKKIVDLASGVKLCFIPKSKDYLIMNADYSQLELRIMAAFAEETAMMKAFQDPKTDIHTWVASMIHSKELKDVSEHEREESKIASFAVVYLATAKSIAEQWNIPVKQVKTLLTKYDAEFPKIKAYQQYMKQYALDHGYVINPYGFIRYTPEIWSEEEHEVARGHRIAVNSPIQGTGSIRCVLAACDIADKFKELGIDATIRGLVHDSISLEIPKDRVEECYEIVKSTMEKPVDFMRDCPLRADFQIGCSYGLVVKYEDYLKDPESPYKKVQSFWDEQEKQFGTLTTHYEIGDLIKEITTENIQKES